MPPPADLATFFAFLSLLLTLVARPIVAINNGHPAHRTATIVAFVGAHADRLALHVLPGYSPPSWPSDEVLRRINVDLAAVTIIATTSRASFLPKPTTADKPVTCKRCRERFADVALPAKESVEVMLVDAGGARRP